MKGEQMEATKKRVKPHAVEGPEFFADELWCDCGRKIECEADDLPRFVRWEFCCACGSPFDWPPEVIAEDPDAR